ncbi:serine hydrolase [Sinosporangium siamense]|uniref:Beta-lactamase-related domain-containing protein n=1 Tax=Sinosporangium siamense TaxID=1367973 RepID=A0A919RM79_9ACTN|nr:serine hydrolase [Sinosporangium siamense]GII94554.1 hypothetical protein Ssi02_47850 [Sinosporangium siamense]
MLLKCKPAVRRALAGWPVAVALVLGSGFPAYATSPDLPQEVGAFADEHLPAQLARHRIPGAAVAVVTKDKQIFTKGYGVADVATRRPVDAEQTVFAPASIGKLITATTVTAATDGTLTTTGAVTHGPAKPRQWLQITPGVFQEKDGYRTIHFREDGLLASENPAGPLQRLAWYELPALHLGVLAVSLAVLLLSALAWPVAFAVRTNRRRPARAPHLAGLPGWTAATLAAVTTASLVALFANFAANQAAYFLGGSPLLAVIQTVPLLAAIATAGAAVTTVLAWRRKWWTRFGRIHLTTVTLAAIAYLAIAAVYNILG